MVFPAPDPPVHTESTPLNSAMSQLLRQAAVESDVVVAAGFDPLVVAAGEPATYRVVITTEPDAVDLPERIPVPPGLELAKSGVGRSVVTKGQVSQYRATFNYRVIAQTPGSFPIGPFELKAGGRRLVAPSRVLTVVPAGSPEARHAASLHLEIPDGDFYVAQAIPVRIVVLDPGDSGVFGLVDPTLLGDAFLFDRVTGSLRREMRTVGGRSVSASIAEVIAIPVREGRLALNGQAFVECRPTADPQSIRLAGYRPFLESSPVEIVVKHLPDGALPGFTGLIGKFEVASPRPSAREVHAGDPLDLAITVCGEGNHGRLIPPRVEHAPGWRVFPAVADVNPPASIWQRGSNVFHYTMIPLKPGMTGTPRIPFSCFDPERQIYVDLTIPSTQILVLASPGGSASGQLQPANAMGANVDNPAGHDLDGLGPLARRPVHFSAGLLAFQQRPAFWLFQLFPGLVLAAFCGWNRRKHFLRAHPEIVRFARARRELRRLERIRRRAIRDHDVVVYARSAIASLREAGAPHLHASPGALVCSDIIRALPHADCEGQAGTLVRQLFLVADEIAFEGKSKRTEMLWSLQPELETLLAQMRRRLC